MDVSERKEDNPTESDVRYRTLFESANDAIFTVEGNVFTDCNPKTLEMFGCTKKEEILGKSPWRFSPETQPDGRSSKEKAQELFSSCIEGEDQRFYWRHSRMDGTEFDAEITLNCVDLGDKMMIQAIVRDTTEQMERVEHLREDEELLKALLNAPVESAMLVDTDGKILAINDIAAERLEKSTDELVGLGMSDYLPPDLVESRRAVGHEVVRTKAPVRFEDERAGRRFENSLYPVIDTEGEVNAIAVYAKDVTERKKTEKDLKVSEEKFSKLFQTSPNVLVISSLEDGRIIDMNDQGIRKLGYERDEIVGKTRDELKIVDPEDLKKLIEMLQRDGYYSDVELQATLKDGSKRFGLFHGHLIDIEGETYLFQTIVDLTERKEMEEALRSSEERYRTMAEASPDAITTTDLEGKVTYASARTAMLHGYDSVDELIGKTSIEFIAEEERERAIVNFGRTIEEGVITEEEFTLLRKDGSRFSGELGAAVIRGPEGEPTGFIGITRDISERRRAEKALRDSETQMRTIIDHLPSVIWKSDPEGNTNFISSNVKNVYGYSADEITEGGSDLWFGRIHSEDLDRVRESYRSLFTKGSLLDIEYRVQRKDDRWIWLNDRANIIIEENGIPYAFGVFTDITERKEAEEEIHNYFELSSDLVCILRSDDSTLTKVNPAFLNALGYSEEELFSKPITEFVHPRMRGKNIPRIQNALEKGETGIRVENLMIAKDGTAKWIAWTINLDAERDLMYAAGRDITHRKEAEQELRRRLMRYRLEDGATYLVMEKVADRSLEAIKDLLSVGLSTTVFSRTPEKAFRRSIEGDFQFHWLATREAEDALTPDIREIERVIEELPMKEAILIDGIGYLTSKNGFDRTLEFVQEIRELAYINDLIVVLTVNPATLEEAQIRLLEIECEELVPLHETMLSEELMEVLRLIVKQHDMNVSPTYLTLVDELGISRPTARKRVTQLVGLGYITDTRRGKTKTFDLTAKGKNLFSK